jgi:hypothetical protein
MRCVKFVLLIFFSHGLFAQNYSVSLIPDSLKQHAHVVKRMEEIKVSVIALDKVVVKRKYALTILDQQGDEYAEYMNNYSSLEDLSDIEGVLYDAAGKKIRSVKKKDLGDAPITDGFSLMLDNRIKKHNFYHRQYPYTIEYSDEQELKNSYHLPYWMPMADFGFAVQQSSFVLETQLNYEMRLKQINFSQMAQPNIQKTKIYNWELTNLKAIAEEPQHPPFKELVPMMYLGPTDFVLGKYQGDMRTWNSLGKLNIELNKGRDEIPAAIKTKVKELLVGASSQEEKVKRLYQFMQSNTRYISIQLGIGGWQPFDAKYVVANRYGDCKALSNYMVSLLKEAGIKANYVLVTAGAGKKGLTEDFPSPYFNHVICCVPNGKDSIWLECTSQSQSAGFMGSFTGNRKALLIAEDGGHVVETPAYSAEKNLQLRKVQASIDQDGNLLAEIQTKATGLQQEDLHSLLHNASKEQRDKYLNSVLGLPTYEVDDSKYQETPGMIPLIDEQLHIKAPNYATVSGKRLFVNPNLLNQSQTKLNSDNDRKLPIQLSYAYIDRDTVEMEIPVSYTLESIPKSLQLKNQFGSYQIQFRVDGNKISVLRERTQETGQYPPADYSKYVEFLDAIYKADHSKMVFVKKEG